MTKKPKGKTMNTFLERMKTAAFSTNSGRVGLVAIAAPFVNSWLVSKGWPSFLDAQGNVSVLTFITAGFLAIANRAAIASKSK